MSASSIASSSVNSWGRSTFDSRSGGFRTSSSPHPHASSNFLGVNNSLADAVKHVWGPGASKPLPSQHQKDQQQRMIEQRQRAVSAHVIDNSTKNKPAAVMQQQQQQQRGASTFQQALKGVTTSVHHRDGTSVDSARGNAVSQYDHFFKGSRVPVLNQNGVAHGDLVLTDTSPLRLSALAGKVHTFGKNQPDPRTAELEAEKKRLAKMTPQERQREHDEKMRKQMAATLSRNFSALNSNLLGEKSSAMLDPSKLPKFMQEAQQAEEEERKSDEEQQQQQQQQAGNASAHIQALEATAAKLTTEALAAAALNKMEQQQQQENEVKKSGVSQVGNPASAAVVPPLFYASRDEENSKNNAGEAISLNDLMKEQPVAAATASGRRHSVVTSSSSLFPSGTARPQQQLQHLQNISSTASAVSSSRGSARRHVDVSAIGGNQTSDASASNCWDAYAGTPFAKDRQQQQQQQQQQSSARRNSTSVDAIYGAAGKQQQNAVRSTTPIRRGSGGHGGTPSRRTSTPTRRTTNSTVALEQQKQQQQREQQIFSDQPPPALFFAAQQGQTEKATTAQAVLAASQLFVRTIGAEATAGSIDVSASTAATLHLKNGQAQQNLSLMSTVSQMRRTAHAEFAELYQQCENLWAELGTSVQARERASYALFPMLFSGSTSSFGSTQLASHRASAVKYINRLSTQLELSTAANEAMNARDGAVFDIIVISKRYTDYVKSTFDTAGGWKEKMMRQGAAAAARDEHSAAEAAAATTQATAIKHELRVALHKYRTCTLVAVEAIAKWMEFTGRVDFWWRNRPALLHMCTDLHQLAFARRPLLYLLGFDVVHNPFVLPGEKWYVVPRRERRLQSVSPARASSMQKRASSIASGVVGGNNNLDGAGGGGTGALAAIVGVGQPMPSSVGGSSSGGSRGRSQSSTNAAAAETLGRVWGASKHKTLGIIDPRRKDGNAQNFILVNEFGDATTSVGSRQVLSSARAASIASHHRKELQDKARQERLTSIQRQYRESSPEHVYTQQQHQEQQRRAASTAYGSNVPDFNLPVTATAVASFWRQMESDDFELRTRMESAIVLMRHAVLQCVVPIQAVAKRFVQMLRYRSELAKVRRLQRYVREWVARRELERTIKIAAWRFLYKIFNGYAVRFDFGRKRRAALTLQRCWRGAMDRRWLEFRAETARRLQRWMRPALRKIINQRRARVRKIQLLHAVARGYLERRRFWLWAAQTLASRRRQVASLFHVERERRVEIQKLYWEATCFGLFAATSASAVTTDENQRSNNNNNDSETRGTTSPPISSSSIFSPYLLLHEDYTTLPQVLRPVHGPLASWAQLSLLFHFDVFRSDILRVQFLNCAAEERIERMKISQTEEAQARRATLAPARALLRSLQTEGHWCTAVRSLVEFSLEPSSRYILSDTFRRERYHIYSECENAGRVVELQEMEGMRRRLILQAEHDARIKQGIHPLSTALSCELLEKEERRRISGIAAQTLAFDKLSVLPDFEQLRREEIAMRWQAVVGFFSGERQQQQQQRNGKEDDGDSASAAVRSKKQQRELFMMLSPLRSSSSFGAFGGEDGGYSPPFGGMQIAHQIELLHLSSEEEIARERLSVQIFSAPVLQFVGRYSTLLSRMARQLAVLTDAQAYAWVKLMSWDGADDAGELEQVVAAAATEADAAIAMAEEQQQKEEERELFPSPGMRPLSSAMPRSIAALQQQKYISSRWEGRFRAGGGGGAGGAAMRTTSRFTPNFVTHFGASSSPAAAAATARAAAGGVAEAATTPNRAAIHEFAVKHSTPTPVKEQRNKQQEGHPPSSSSSFTHMSEIALASANPMLFRALISHARRLQRIGRAYLDRSGVVFFLHCESQDRRDIVNESIAELYFVVEELKRDKMLIQESVLRAQRTQHIRVALGLVEAMCKKRAQYRLRRMAAKLILYPALAQQYNSRIALGFPPQHQDLFAQENAVRTAVQDVDEKVERGRLLHECLLSAQRAMTGTITRRWSEHEELVAKARETEAQNQRRERILQDKIYELLQQKDGDVSAVTEEANRLLAKEMAATERVKEVMWGQVRAVQIFAEQEKQLFVGERAERTAMVRQEAERRAAIARESAQASFLSVCSSPQGRGVVDPPLAFFSQSRSGVVDDQHNTNRQGGPVMLIEEETTVLSPELRIATRRDRDHHYFQWLASRAGLSGAAATYGDIQPLLSPPPALTQQQTNQMLVDAVEMGDVVPWQKNILLQQQQQQPKPAAENSSDINAAGAAAEQLLDQLTPIASPAAQRASARGAALLERQQQQKQQYERDLFDARSTAAAAAPHHPATTTGLSFLSTNSVVSPGAISAPSVQRDDGFSDSPAVHSPASSNRRRAAQQHQMNNLSSADASVAENVLDALSHVGDVPQQKQQQHQHQQQEDDLWGGGGDDADIWAAHDAVCNHSKAKEVVTAAERPMSPPARVIEVPKAVASSGTAGAHSSKEENVSPPAQDPRNQQQRADDIIVSPPPILGVQSSAVRRKEPSLERKEQQQLQQRSMPASNLPIAFGVATSMHPTASSSSVDRQGSAGSTAVGPGGRYSVSSARDSSARRRVIKKAAVIHHPNQQQHQQQQQPPTIPMNSGKFSLLPPRRSLDRSDDSSASSSGGSEDEDEDETKLRDGRLLIASARTAQTVAAATAAQNKKNKKQTKSNDELKAQYEYERDLFSAESTAASAAVTHHLDSSRGAISVPRGALRPQSAGERNSSKQQQQQQTVTPRDQQHQQQQPASTPHSSSRSGTPSLRSMQMMQQQQRHQQQMETDPLPQPQLSAVTSARRSTANKSNKRIESDGNSSSVTTNTSNTSLMSLFHREKSNNNLLTNPSNTSAAAAAAAHDTSSVSSARRVFGASLPRAGSQQRQQQQGRPSSPPANGGDAWSPSAPRQHQHQHHQQQQEASPPLNWTTHAAAMSNRDSDVPDQIKRMEDFMGKVRGSVENGKKHRTAAAAAGNNTSLLRRASDVMTEEEIAEMELERAQQAAAKQQRLERQQQFISNSSSRSGRNEDESSTSGLLTSSDFVSSQQQSGRSRRSNTSEPGSLGLGQVVSPQRVRVHDAACHYRYFNNNGEPADRNLLRSNISGAMERAAVDASSAAPPRDDDFVVAHNPQMAHRYGIVRPSSAPQDRMQALSKVTDMMVEQRDEAERQRRGGGTAGGAMDVKKLAATRRQLKEQDEDEAEEDHVPSSRLSPARGRSAAAAAQQQSTSASPPPSPTRKTVRFNMDEQREQEKELLRGSSRPSNSKIVLRRAHEIITPPRVEGNKENNNSGSQQQQQAAISLPRTKAASSEPRTEGSNFSPPQIMVQSPSQPRSPAVNKNSATSVAASAAAGGRGTAGSGNTSLNSSRGAAAVIDKNNLSAHYKSDMPWEAYLLGK